MNAQNGPIALVEAAYNLEVSEADWLPNLLRAGGDLLNLGQGCAGAILAGKSCEGAPLVSQIHTENASDDLATRLALAARDVEPSISEAPAPPPEPTVHTLSEARDTHPEVHEALSSHLRCEDMLALWAVDPDMHGVGIHIPSSRLIHLDWKARKRWKMLSSHISAGHRLRRQLGLDREGVPLAELPVEDGAVLDSQCFSVTDAMGQAKGGEALSAIRKAAIQTECARRRLRHGEAEQALNLWEEVVRGRWSIVDWFDSDGRRFILALPNAPDARDPRGLTEREIQVAAQVSTGDSCKLVAYRLRISRSRVSALLHGAMLKLGVQSRPELIVKIRTLLADTASKM